MSDINQLKLQYLEATRLYLWYKGSAFSVSQGKSSKELAEKYRNLIHENYIKYLEEKYA